MPLKSCWALHFENLVGDSSLLRRKGGSHYEIMVNFKKITKQKLNLQSEGMFTMSMHTMSDGKNKLLLHYCTNINMDEPGILLFKSYCLRNDGWFAISKKNWLFNKTSNIHLCSPSWYTTSCFYSNPSESSSIYRVHFRI